MITVFVVLWKLSWRYRVRPRTAHQHELASRHDVVSAGTATWYCCDCAWSSEHTPSWSTRDRIATAVVAATTVCLAWLGWRLGSVI